MIQIKDIKQWLVGYSIGLIEADQIITNIDKLILSDEWISEFSDLSTISFYNRQNIYNLLSFGTFQVNFSDISVFEKRLIFYLISVVKNNTLNWKTGAEYIYSFLMLKQKLLNLTSNDLNDFWFGIINYTELQKDGLPTNIVNSKEFLVLLESFDLKKYDLLSDLLNIDLISC